MSVTATGTTANVTSLLRQPDGNFVVGAIGFPHLSSDGHILLARFLANGAADTGFGTNGLFHLAGVGFDDYRTYTVVRQSTGALIAAGSLQQIDANNFAETHSFAIRLTPSGGLDTTFGSNGLFASAIGASDALHDVIALSDDSLVGVGSDAAQFMVMWMTADGSLNHFTTTAFAEVQSSYSYGAPAEAYAAVRQPDGKLVVVGYATVTNNAMSSPSAVMARYAADGSLDTTFGTAGQVFSVAGNIARDVVIQPDGKIVVSAILLHDSTNPNGGGDLILSRYNSDGSLDSTFGTGGIVLSHSVSMSYEFIRPRGLVLQSDGRFVVAGTSVLARFHPNGSPDTSFGGDGGPGVKRILNVSGYWMSLVEQPDGKLVVAGQNSAPGTSILVARYLGSICNNSVLDPGETCEDGNLASDDGCNPDCEIEECWSCTGVPSTCAPLSAGTPCSDDNNPCTSDACATGTCTHPADNAGVSCTDDGSPCTLDQCDGVNTNCQHPADPAAEGIACDDNNSCTSPDTCHAGQCAGLNACTAALCPNPTGTCVVSGKLSLPNRGTADLGGRDLQLTGSGALTVAAGGSFAIANAGGVTVEKGTLISSLATKGTMGGSLQVDSTGPCSIDGKIKMDGTLDKTHGIGTDGGSITLNCSAIAIGGLLETKGVGVSSKTNGASPGSGGSITLNATNGTLELIKKSKLIATGKGASGGAVQLTATGACTVDAAIALNSPVLPVPNDVPVGGDGGVFSASCATVSLSSHASIAAGSVKSAQCGSVEVTANAGSATMEKGAKLTDHGSCDSVLHVTATDACNLAGVVKSNAVDGEPGAVELDCNDITLDTSFRLKNSALGASGGSLIGQGGGACSLNGAVTMKGGEEQVPDSDPIPGMGGSVDFACSSIAVGGTIDVSAKDARSNGGEVSLVADGALTVANKIASTGAVGGNATLEGCDVTVNDTGNMDVHGHDGGVLDVVAHDALVVTGRLSAQGAILSGGSPGTINMLYLNSVSVPNASHIVPTTMPSNDTSLDPCP